MNIIQKLRAAKIVNLLPWIILATVLLFGAVVVILVMTGKLQLVWKDPSQQVVVHDQEVCSEDIIDRYNIVVAETLEASEYEEVKNEATALDNWETDPNCVYIALRYHLLAGNAVEARELYEQLVELSDGHRRISDKIALPMDRHDIARSVEWLEVFDATDFSEAGSG